jgi:hypothetical protein
MRFLTPLSPEFQLEYLIEAPSWEPFDIVHGKPTGISVRYSIIRLQYPYSVVKRNDS